MTKTDHAANTGFFGPPAPPRAATRLAARRAATRPASLQAAGYELAQEVVLALYQRVRELSGPGSGVLGHSPYVELVRELLRTALMLWNEKRRVHPGLAIEHLGFVYEVLMQFRLERTTGPSLSLRSVERLGPPVTVNLEELMALPAAGRVKWLTELIGRKPSARLRRGLQAATSVDDLAVALAPLVDREATPTVVPAGSWVLQPSLERRRSGCHYTSRGLAEVVVRRTLGPLLASLRGPDGESPRPERILEVKVCDPAMGSGVFLLEACRQLAEVVAESWRDRGAEPAVLEARRLVAEHCLYGVDRDPLAVQLAKTSLWLLTQVPEAALGRALELPAITAGPPLSFEALEVPPSSFLAHALKCGDALVGEVLGAGPGLTFAAELRAKRFDWATEFPEVFARENPGFDVVVGNPPWVSYVGRAAQPLDPALRAHYERAYGSFRGYRNLQGLFVERSVQLTRAGGRVGLLLPSSMAELEGYGPTRAAHDRLAEPDAELADLGEDCFGGVFQPCMALTSTVRARPGGPKAGQSTSARPRPVGAPWPLERPDLDREARQLLDHLGSLPTLPAELFGERGMQTTRGDHSHLASRPTDLNTVPFRVGGDILPFRRGPASLWADPAWFGERIRPPEEWSRVRLLVRQTARVPMAALSDGLAFRNSLLAGFETPEYPADFLVAYLNSTPIRWLHYHRNRDARMGMPQVKISHLRALPALLPSQERTPLAALGFELSARNSGITAAEQRQIDELVADLLGLTPAQLERMWADAHKWSQWSHLCA